MQKYKISGNFVIDSFPSVHRELRWSGHQQCWGSRWWRLLLLSRASGWRKTDLCRWRTVQSAVQRRSNLLLWRDNCSTYLCSKWACEGKTLSNFISRPACPTGWLRFGDSCYQEAALSSSAQEAEDLCLEQEAHLFMPESVEEWDWVNEIFKWEVLNFPELFLVSLVVTSLII